jgi:hypothetical protein
MDGARLSHEWAKDGDPKKNVVPWVQSIIDEVRMDERRHRPKNPHGAWMCTHCGTLEHVEREVGCWQCRLGEMVYCTNVNNIRTPRVSPLHWLAHVLRLNHGRAIDVGPNGGIVIECRTCHLRKEYQQ